MEKLRDELNAKIRRYELLLKVAKAVRKASPGGRDT